MSRIQNERGNIFIVETCSPTDRLHFVVDGTDYIDVVHHTVNGYLTLTAFKIPQKLYHKPIHDFGTSSKYAVTELKINRLEGKPILQTNPNCHSHCDYILVATSANDPCRNLHCQKN